MRATRVGEIQDRFWSRVDKSGGPASCWNWTGSVSSSGYGVISGKLNGVRLAPVGQTLLAHRVSWMMANCIIPSGGPGYHGYVVLHRCDNRLCVNPAHLALGTQEANIADMDRKGRANRLGMLAVSGPKHKQAKLTAEQEAEVLAIRDPARQVAARFGVCKSVIQRIRRQNMTPEERAALRAENYRKRYT